jgi:glycosyltransferase involved in cell wall biosynthesis
MKVSVIISLCDNRLDLFKRSLDTWVKQSLPKEDFEIIVVDDANRRNIHELCRDYSKIGLQFQIIQIDNEKCDLPILTFTPVLSNNVGFRQAKGEVVCITGPETLQSERNLEIAYTFKDRQQCGYGLVYKSNALFVQDIAGRWAELKGLPVRDLLRIQGAAVECLTRPPHPPAYAYFVSVAKKYVEKIGGIDERFGQGFCGEDDDFANRMKMIMVEPVFEHKILGIHQDHSEIDKKSQKHSLRKTPEGVRLRKKNIELMSQTQLTGTAVANKDHLWGDPKVIIYHEVL